MANLHQVEIRVGPSQFRSTASPVRRVPARGVVDRLKAKKDYNKMNIVETKKTFEDNANIILIKQGKEP